MSSNVINFIPKSRKINMLGTDIRKILITGGAGFIGSALIQALNQFEVEVLVIDDLSFGKREFAEVPASHFGQIDILETDRLDRVIRGFQPDWIIHLAAVHFIPWCNEHPSETARINIFGTHNLLDVARRSNPNLKGFFFASSAAVYPICDEAIEESNPLAPLDIYGLTKLAGEHMVKAWQLETGIPALSCRFFNAFGPNETNPHLIPEIADQINAGARTLRLGNQKPKRDFIHTSDMAQAVIALMEHFVEGYDEFNLGRGEEYSVLEVVDAFSKAIGEPIQVEVDPAKVRQTDRLHLLANIDKISRFTGWEPQVSLEEGIATLVHQK